jgi:competence protein ComEA
MSDASDLDEAGFPPLAPTDWRDRFGAVCDALGVSRPAALLALAGIVLVVAVGGVAMIRRDAAPVEATLPFTRPAEAVTTTIDPEPDEIVVHVAGSVAAPGVHRLPVDARVIDAVDAAGGTTPAADLARLNLAAPLVDGQQVYVVAIGEDPPPPVAGPQPGGDQASALVDINRASAVELEALPGIGPALAAAIVGHRDEHGPFVAVESLLDVSGIGEAKLAGLRDFATV